MDLKSVNKVCCATKNTHTLHHLNSNRFRIRFYDWFAKNISSSFYDALRRPKRCECDCKNHPATTTTTANQIDTATTDFFWLIAPMHSLTSAQMRDQGNNATAYNIIIRQNTASNPKMKSFCLDLLHLSRTFNPQFVRIVWFCVSLLMLHCTNLYFEFFFLVICAWIEKYKRNRCECSMRVRDKRRFNFTATQRIPSKWSSSHMFIEHFGSCSLCAINLLLGLLFFILLTLHRILLIYAPLDVSMCVRVCVFFLLVDYSLCNVFSFLLRSATFFSFITFSLTLKMYHLWFLSFKSIFSFFFVMFINWMATDEWLMKTSKWESVFCLSLALISTAWNLLKSKTINRFTIENHEK